MGKEPNVALLTVSGRIPTDIAAQVARGERPLADYLAMSDAFPADLLDYTLAERQSGWIGRLLKRLGGPNLVLAWVCFWLRKKYRIIFFDGEQVGIPYAILTKFFGARANPRHMMISHILSVGKKALLFDVFGLHRIIDVFFVYSSWQKQFIQQRWKVPAERVVFTPFMVDAKFFSPDRLVKALDLDAHNPYGYPMICTAGLERRDYATLIEAIRGQNVFVVIAAASPWAKQRDAIGGVSVPENIHIQKFSQYDLRSLYAHSRFVVMPLQNVEFQAGVTAILEAMAMEKAVICTQTPGQTDVVVDQVTGLYVPPADVAALRSAILDLLAHPEKAANLGRNGRARIIHEMSLDCYVERLRMFVQGLRSTVPHE